MVNLKTMGIAALVMAVAIVMAVRYWPNDERAIRKQLALIETLGSKEADEKPIDSLLHARQLAELFNDPCIIQVESVDFQGQFPRKQIQDMIVMVRGHYTQATVSVHDLRITLPKKQSATLHCTMRVKGEGAARPVADVQELAAELRKVEDDWLFTSVTLVEVLER